MKRHPLTALLLAGLMCLSAAACAAPEAPSPGPEETLKTQAPAPAAPTKSPGDEAPPAPAEPAAPASQEQEGWNLAVTRAIGDKNCAFLYLELTAPEGTALDADNYFLECMPMMESSQGCGFGMKMLEDDDPKDNRISFLLDISSDGDMRGAKGVLSASKLEAIYWSADHQRDKVIPLVTAQWEVPFQINSADETISFQAGETIQTSQGPVTLETVEAGPFSVEMVLSGQNITEMRFVPDFRDGTARPGELLFQLLDETGVPMETTGDQTTVQSETRISLVSKLDPAAGAQPARIAAVVLDGVKITLAQ